MEDFRLFYTLFYSSLRLFAINLESEVASVSFESFADSAGIIDQHVLCVQSSMHFTESAALSGSSQ